MISDDTIVAISSAVGPAARMIVRMSGPDSSAIATAFIDGGAELARGAAVRVRLHVADLPCPATFYCFRAPHSATGEDLIEIHLPGNPMLARLVLDAALSAGARAAEPGEFTARSYFNGRLDLIAAEGVAAVISAQSEAEIDAARRLLSGEMSRRLAPATELLAQTLALVEAQIDFAGEEISVLAYSEVMARIKRIDADLSRLLSESSRFEALSYTPRIVLVGRPNAGKSTLLNVLAGTDRAIVSPVAGTTRDVLTADIALRRGIAKLVDVAGVDGVIAHDQISKQMSDASLQAVRVADIVVLVREVGDDSPEMSLPVQPHLRIRSKADLSRSSPGDFCVSAHTGVGLENLRARFDEIAFGANPRVSTLALNARHIRCINDARSSLSRAGEATELELIAFDLRESLDMLGMIVGSVTPDDVLGRIFSAFCIGK